MTKYGGNTAVIYLVINEVKMLFLPVDHFCAMRDGQPGNAKGKDHDGFPGWWQYSLNSPLFSSCGIFFQQSAFRQASYQRIADSVRRQRDHDPRSSRARTLPSAVPAAGDDRPGVPHALARRGGAARR